MISVNAALRGLRLAILLVIGCVVFSAARAADDSGYKLGPGDELRVTVFGEDDLSGKYVVSAQGSVAMPLIGQVEVTGKTIPQTQSLIGEKYGANYLVNPRVSVEVLNYRPFYILGEVNKPGSYPYVSSMTVLDAVALAGGFTPRADESDIVIKHGDDPSAPGHRVKEDAPVFPGDVVRINERFF